MHELVSLKGIPVSNFKIGPKNGPKSGPKNGPKSGPKNGLSLLNRPPESGPGPEAQHDPQDGRQAGAVAAQLGQHLQKSLWNYFSN